jgi:addiction module RelE/StbE family toxin
VTRVVWTGPARDDLREIRAYITQDSARYARVVVERLVAAVRRLREYPLSGRVVPELARPTFREVIEGAYRIVYRVTPRPHPDPRGRARRPPLPASRAWPVRVIRGGQLTFVEADRATGIMVRRLSAVVRHAHRRALGHSDAAA